MSNQRLDEILKQTHAKVTTAVPVDSHPDTIAPFGQSMVDGQGGPAETAFTAARMGLRSLYDGRAELQSAYDANKVTVDKTLRGTGSIPGWRVEIPADRRAALASAMAAKFSSVAKAMDRNDEAITNAIGELESGIAKALQNPRRNDTAVAHEAAEIRGHMKSLEPSARMQFLMEAIADGDRVVVDAVLGYSPFAAGLDRKQHAIIREQAAAKFASREHGQLKAARELHAKFRAAGASFTAAYTKMLPVVGKEDAGTTAIKRLKGEAA